MFYVVEERRVNNAWEAVQAEEFKSQQKAMKRLATTRSLFGSTPGVRWVLTQNKPEGPDWEWQK